MTYRYFFDTLFRTQVAFYKQFTDIHIYRVDSDGAVLKDIKVEMFMDKKMKFYKRLNTKSPKNTQVVLPAMSCWVSAMDYIVSRQRNPMGGTQTISKEDNTIVKHLPSPSPVDLEMTLLIKTKYDSDMRRILETIVPQFQPTKTVRVNLIPQIGLSIDIPMRLESISVNDDFDMGEDTDSKRVLEYEMTFRMHTFIYPPIEDRDIIRELGIYNNNTKTTLYGQFSPDAVIKKELEDHTANSDLLVESFTLNGDDFKNSNVYLRDMSSVIASESTKFRMVDGQTNEDIPFAFEYSNGEFYGCDELVPSHLTLSRTGWCVYKIERDFEDVEPFKILVYESPITNYVLPNQIFDVYEDFNVRSSKNLYTDKQNEKDLVYASAGQLHIELRGDTIDAISKVYPTHSIPNFVSLVYGVESFVYGTNAHALICGMSDEQGSYVILHVGDAENHFELYKHSGGVETRIGELTTASQLSKIEFSTDGEDDGRIRCTLNNSDFLIFDNEAYIIPVLLPTIEDGFNFDYFLMH